MCLLVFNWQPDGDYPLVFVGNRDEFHERPAEPMAWWDQPYGLLAGRDVTGGGTWLGVTRSGRFAVVTNYREMGASKPGAPSRGDLVTSFADLSVPADAHGDRLASTADTYAGYNLLFGEPLRGWLSVFSNRDGPTGPNDPKPIEPGVHGLSNHLLDTPWPKLVRTRARLETALSDGAPDTDELLAILADRQQADAAELPDTGIGHEWETLLSSPFIVNDTYGTRCSTVLVVRADGTLSITERSFDPAGHPTGERSEQFNVEAIL